MDPGNSGHRDVTSLYVDDDVRITCHYVVRDDAVKVIDTVHASSRSVATPDLAIVVELLKRLPSRNPAWMAVVFAVPELNGLNADLVGQSLGNMMVSRGSLIDFPAIKLTSLGRFRHGQHNTEKC